MKIKNYIKNRNEVNVYGCSTCPFLWYHERATDYGPFCCLGVDIGRIPSENFPYYCPLKDPNFKFTRYINE